MLPRPMPAPAPLSRMISKVPFAPPIGEFRSDGPLEGYYLDLREKAREPKWPPPWLPERRRQLHVAAAQWALGALEHHRAGEGEQWLAAAVDAGEHLLAIQRDDGAWEHQYAYPHTYRIAPPWLSAMAQGEGASVLVRLHLLTGDRRYADAARRALELTSVRDRDGGVLGDVDGVPFLEEYPTDPPCHVLNGAIFATWGWLDVGRGLGDQAARRRFGELADGIADRVDRFDTGYWSTYDLFPHPVKNVASPDYHLLHINQLRALHRLHPRPELAAAADRFEAYRDDPLKRRRALAVKVAFRFAVPRNRHLANRLPWSR